jgi:hypothetical protein
MVEEKNITLKKHGKLNAGFVLRFRKFTVKLDSVCECHHTVPVPISGERKTQAKILPLYVELSSYDS